VADGPLLHVASAAVPGTIDIVRREWAEGYRRLEETRSDPEQYRRLLDQVDALTDELRKRVGGTYTLRQLEEAYRGSERWAREAIAERAAWPGWPRTLTTVAEAAFYVYQRGALDYAP
jgi:hypothetical protein